jgi:hypothetical protein
MIQELMIINQAGIALYYHNFINKDKLDDKQSLASYFDVICRFTKQSFKESLKTLELDSFIFFFYTHKSNFHLVLKCENKKFDKNILESVSENILEAFISKYDELLRDFNGEISLFKSFSKDLIKIYDPKVFDSKNLLITEH